MIIFNSLHFYYKRNYMQVLNIYWQAWGYEQSQLRKLLYIRKTSAKLDKVIKYVYINSFSKMNFYFPTRKDRDNYLKSLIKPQQNIKDLMDDLDFISYRCLCDRLPIHISKPPIPPHRIYNRSRSRIFRPFNKVRKISSFDSLRRVDAIVCLF